LSLLKENNLYYTKDETLGPKVSFVRRFHCIE
jgi:hypothetical protein